MTTEGPGALRRSSNAREESITAVSRHISRLKRLSIRFQDRNRPYNATFRSFNMVGDTQKTSKGCVFTARGRLEKDTVLPEGFKAAASSSAARERNATPWEKYSSRPVSRRHGLIQRRVQPPSKRSPASQQRGAGPLQEKGVQGCVRGGTGGFYGWNPGKGTCVWFRVDVLCL